MAPPPQGRTGRGLTAGRAGTARRRTTPATWRWWRRGPAPSDPATSTTTRASTTTTRIGTKPALAAVASTMKTPVGEPPASAASSYNRISWVASSAPAGSRQPHRRNPLVFVPLAIFFSRGKMCFDAKIYLNLPVANVALQAEKVAYLGATSIPRPVFDPRVFEQLRAQATRAHPHDVVYRRGLKRPWRARATDEAITDVQVGRCRCAPFQTCL
jgi:hypothetical protein